MAWLILIAAGMCEVVGVLGINRLNVRRDAVGALLLAGGFAASFLLLGVAMRTISLGTAYAVWTAIGTVGGTAVGMIFFGESRGAWRIFFLCVVVGAAVGLKLAE